MQKKDFGVEIYISDERKELLDTGGAIFFAQEFLKTGDNFLVHNVDIISNINLNKMLETHIQQENIATLAVRNRDTKRKLCFDEKMQLLGRESNDSSSHHCNSFAFSGIQFISTKIFDLTDKSGKFSLIDLYLALAPKNKIIGYSHDTDYWKDMGKFEDFL
ncbi:MAG: hypothetical protein LBC89_00840 [Bacteroidales bacterium]|nr:hypothetical protein [Bacteroidales bacterium]